MPDPASNAYARYRDGLVRRHIVCSGRYLSDLWLKEYEPNSDSRRLARHSRTFTVPAVPSFVSFKVPLLGSGTWTESGGVAAGPYFIKLDQETVSYKLPGIGSGVIREHRRMSWGSYFLEFLPGQRSHVRTYIPWLVEDEIILGGGENPLLRGGIAMACFAVEYMATGKRGSLRYAQHLLQYFERSEFKDVNQRNTGFFYRCDHISNASGQIGLHFSVDELVGMVMGLYYFYIATDRQGHRARIRRLVGRLGSFLQRNGYILLGPGTPQTLQRGFGAPYLFQWALQQAFQRITGSRFEPRQEDYATTSERLSEVYVNRGTRITHGAQASELLGIMYLWAKTGKIDESQGDRWIAALRDAVGASVGESRYVRMAFLGMVPDALDDVVGTVFQELQVGLDLSWLASAFERYVLNISVQQKIVYFWSTESWFNRAMTLHTTHYALDDVVISANRDGERARRAAQATSAMVKTMLCGERIPKPIVPGFELGSADNDFYAAVVARGLLSRYVPLGTLKCSPLPQEIGPAAAAMEYPYVDRVNEAIEERRRMWEEQPLSELWWVRNQRPGWEAAPVSWHNSPIKEQAKRGMDFCWERYPDSNRVFGWGRTSHRSATGLSVIEPEGCTGGDEASDSCKPSPVLRGMFARGLDVALESGGLDFLFPRILMAYWCNEPVNFEDSNAPLLRGITCLPWESDGEYTAARCRRGSSDWLLFSSPA